MSETTDSIVELVGIIDGAHRYEQKVCTFPFRSKSGETRMLCDPDRLLPSYSVVIQYTLLVDKESGRVLTCAAAKRAPRCFPLTQAKLRKELSKHSKYGSARLTREFKNRSKDIYTSEKAMVEFIDCEPLRGWALCLFDRAFQPDDYYFVACYLNGPELRDKSAEELAELKKLLQNKPTLCCFLSSFVTTAARGMNDMSLDALQRCTTLLGVEADTAASPNFQSSVTIYQRWIKEMRCFGSTRHQLCDEEDEEHIDYLLQQKLAFPLPDGSSYYLLRSKHFGDGAIADWVQHLVPEVGSETVVDEFSYRPEHMPLLLVRHCGSNHYSTMRALLQVWEGSSCSTDRPEIRVFAENLYHAQQFEQQTSVPVEVYCEGEPPTFSDTVGLLVLERVHLWDSVCVGRLLHSFRSTVGSNERVNLILSGDQREMPVYAGRGSGAVFSDLYSSHLFPVVYVQGPPVKPTTVPDDVMPLLQKGSRLPTWGRSYQELERMSLREFREHWTQLRSVIRGSSFPSVRVLVPTSEQAALLYQDCRKIVWDEADAERAARHIHVNEAVYSSRLKQTLHARAVECLHHNRNSRGVSATYTRDMFNFPCTISANNHSDSLLLYDSVTGEACLTPLRYSEGLYPVTVDTYSRLQTYSYVDILFLVVQRDTPWRVLYTALTKTRTRFCLLIEEDLDLDELLNHIVDQNWKAHNRRGALYFLLQEQEEESRPAKRICVTPPPSPHEKAKNKK